MKNKTFLLMLAAHVSWTLYTIVDILDGRTESVVALAFVKASLATCGAVFFVWSTRTLRRINPFPPCVIVRGHAGRFDV